MSTMREANGPPIEPLPITAHLLQPLIERASRDPGQAIAAYREDDHYVDVTAGEFHQRMRQLAKGLIGERCEPGDRVALDVAHAARVAAHRLRHSRGRRSHRSGLRDLVGRAAAVDSQR